SLDVPPVKITSPGITTDVATNPDGTMIAAVLGPNRALTSGALHSIDKEGAKREILFSGAIWRASHSNYAKFTPDGKHLFVSSFAGRDRSGNMQNPGLDVYVPDQKAESGFKKISSIRSAIRVNSGVSVGGYFDLTPDGENAIFHNGAVIAVGKVTVSAENASSIPEPDTGMGP